MDMKHLKIHLKLHHNMQKYPCSHWRASSIAEFKGLSYGLFKVLFLMFNVLQGGS